MKKILFLIVLIFIFTSSCGQFRRKYPARNFYTLEVSQLENRESTGKEYLEIVKVRLNPEYYHQDFNYKISSNQFQNDFYNEFYKPVEVIVFAELYKWLSNAGIFKQVVPPNSIIDAKYYLYANIVDIYADFSGASPKAVLNMQFFLVDESETIPKLVYTNVYSQQLTLSDALPNTIVNGWNEALKNIFTSFQNDLSSLPQLQS